LKLNPRQTYFDRLTKWPGKGKAVEHAQQNVKTAMAAGHGRRLGHWPNGCLTTGLFWVISLVN
ncbi:MAG TPA: hypothetical protein VJ800_00995, partial [Pseudolabrys sp.]|nr:hypothetical protein [Pseudolabrys sp.]